MASRAGLTLDPAQASLRGQDAIPSFDSRGRLHIGSAFDIRLAGVLPGWLDAWPALPEPLHRSRSPIPFQMAYRGAPDLSGLLSLGLQRDATRFQGELRLREVLAWNKARATDSPIPPLDGQLSTPRLDIGGAVLEGVEMRTDHPGIP